MARRIALAGAIWDDLAWTERDDRVPKIEDAAAGHSNGKCRGASPTSHLRSAALPIAAVFVAVVIFDADLHPPPRQIFIVASIISVSVRAIPASVVLIAVSAAILVAITMFVALAALHVLTNFPVVPVTPMHLPIGTHLAIIASGLAPSGSLISRLLDILVRWGGLTRHASRRRGRRLPFALRE